MDSDGQVHRWLAVGEPGSAKKRTRAYLVPFLDVDCLEIRHGGPQPTAVIDRHRPHPCNR